jgi:hypothetical protein
MSRLRRDKGTQHQAVEEDTEQQQHHSLLSMPYAARAGAGYAGNARLLDRALLDGMDRGDRPNDLGEGIVLAILVPVLGRDHQIEPLLESIAASTESPYRVVFICSPSDPAREICLASDADTVIVPWEPDRADFAKKINLAYNTFEEDWYFQAATDLVFQPGWDTRAFHVARNSRCGVIGTNDLGNPSVQRGHHATHIIFSRAYIEEYGSGTFDGSGAVFSELYDHQFCDTEFIQTAKLRKQFKPSLRSVVEHMHPHWGKGEMDGTYLKSERSYREDAALYSQRMRILLRRAAR